MTDLPDFSRLLSSSQGSAEALALVDPEGLAAKKPSVASAWKFLSGSIALRRAGHTSEANAWFNASMSATGGIETSILRAEQVAEGGLGLFAEKRLSDAANILQGAAPQWDALCRAASDVKPGGSEAATVGREVAEMLDALEPKQLHGKWKASELPALAKNWLANYAVLRYAQVFSAYIQILAKAGQCDDARNVYKDVRGWIESNLTSPSSSPLPGRVMTGTTRHALYRLMLAHGELELATGAFQASADAFGEAVNLYDGHVWDTADVSRMIQAHTNQANSLLRLGRFDEALGIYELAEMGFHSIHDEASADRVQHAKLFAKMKKEEAVGH